ncbi:MAG: hypothetical protein LC104_03520 [Bacteroidales bacterium]|nr:hypothetical protein [Bacteroidales bacterium]
MSAISESYLSPGQQRLCARIVQGGITGAAIIGFLMMTGCGNGLSALNGTVTVDGKPAPAGISLSFIPVDGGSPSYATTDEKGQYEAMFTFQEKGIQPGRVRVQLVPGEAGNESMPELIDEKPVVKPQAARPTFPKEYYQEITIITVEKGANTIEIPLSTQAK